jgi:sulfur-carrier protein
MPVTFSLPTILAKLADGQTTFEVNGSTLGEVVAGVSQRFPQLAPRLQGQGGDPYPFVAFYLNDEDSRFKGGFDAEVRDGDEITVVAAISGG